MGLRLTIGTGPLPFNAAHTLEISMHSIIPLAIALVILYLVKAGMAEPEDSDTASTPDPAPTEVTSRHSRRRNQ